ncbi:MFS transporter [Rhizobium sp. P40RR-XXII]|uniref:MFS transporter n=1 Tax=Rhizobium sp. P40RR-XXII TaxID=2726739 RepID=UPI001457672A|nr:MFS transporter [Rhizobium sp. P40RR-XXII]NLS20730.1 MFS transporter [Rhizobium sp. P40RR-XXII]
MTAFSAPAGSRWDAVFSIAVGTFMLVTSEFLPIGLLSHIAEQFDIDPGQAGLLVTTPGIVAAIAAPVCTIAARDLDRRLLLIGFTILVLISNLVVAIASSIELAIIGRALLGVSVGGFWTFAAAVGRKLVSGKEGNRATSIIMAGISIGTVIGVPLGSALGSVMGWRLSLIAVAALCLIVAVAQAILLPKILIETGQSLAGLLDAARSRSLTLAFAATGLAAGGHFAAYTYLEPHLNTNARLDPTALGLFLAIYGAFGIVGTFIGEHLSRQKPAHGFMLVAFAMAISIILTAFFSWNLLAEGIAVAFWGTAFGAVPVCVQIWTFVSDPARFESSSAITVSVFQIALAAGSFFGGMIADAQGFTAAFVAGAFFNLMAALLVATTMFLPKFRTKEI